MVTEVTKDVMTIVTVTVDLRDAYEQLLVVYRNEKPLVSSSSDVSLSELSALEASSSLGTISALFINLLLAATDEGFFPLAWGFPLQKHKRKSAWYNNHTIEFVPWNYKLIVLLLNLSLLTLRNNFYK